MDNNDLNLTVKAKDEASANLKNVNRNVKQVSDTAKTSTKDLQIAGAALGAVGIGLTAYSKNATDATVTYYKSVVSLSRVTGENVEATSRLQYVLQRSGLEAGQSAQAFTFFNKQLLAAKNAGDDASTSLGQIGVKATNSNGTLRSFSDVLLDVADKFKAMPDGAEKSALAVDLFGRSGRIMVGVLNQGSEGIKALEKDADSLGLTLNAQNAGGIKKYIQSQKDLKATSDALKIAVGSLTAPVLANFQTKVNNVVSSLVKSDGPLKTATINTLAFGGPVFTAAGAAVGLAANVRTAAAGLNVMAAASKAAAFATGPVGIALGLAATAITIGIGLFASHANSLKRNTSATEQQTTVEEELNAAMQETAANTDRLIQANDLLTDSRFSAEGAALSVERAQRSYNDAVKEYGPKSLEAREASYNLEEANRRLQDANEKVAEAQGKVNDVEGILVENTANVLNAIQLRADKYNDVIGTVSNAINAVAQLDQVTLNVVGTVNGRLQNAANTAQNAANTVQRNFNSIQIGGGNIQGSAGTGLQGGRAAGGPVSAGRIYPVGENPDGSFNKTTELFVPSSSGTVVNAEDTRKLLSQVGGGSNISINFTVQGNVVGNESGLRALAVEMQRMVEQALRGQGVDTVSQLRSV